MIVHIQLEHLRTALKDLEQDKLSRADRGYIIRLLRELAEATEKSPTIEGEPHSMITVKIEGSPEPSGRRAGYPPPDEPEKLRRLADSEATQKSLTEALGALLEAALQSVVGVNDSYIFTYEAGRLSFGAARSTGSEPNPAWMSPRPNGLTYTVARLGQPMVIPNMNDHPLFAGTGWSGSIIGIPLKIGPRIVGVMTTVRKPADAFTPEEIGRLQELADRAAIEIENARIANLAREQVRIDASTGLHNRRALDEHLQSEIFRAGDVKGPFALFMLNVDGFSDVGARYGRSAADYLMAGIATAAAQGLRKSDFLARYDETRWCLVVNRADRDTAQSVAERIQEAVTRRRFNLPDKEMKNVSLSMGIAIYPEHGDNAEKLIDVANQALRAGQAQQTGSITFAPGAADSGSTPAVP